MYLCKSQEVSSQDALKKSMMNLRAVESHHVTQSEGLHPTNIVGLTKTLRIEAPHMETCLKRI